MLQSYFKSTAHHFMVVKYGISGQRLSQVILQEIMALEDVCLFDLMHIDF